MPNPRAMEDPPMSEDIERLIGQLNNAIRILEGDRQAGEHDGEYQARCASVYWFRKSAEALTALSARVKELEVRHAISYVRERRTGDAIIRYFWERPSLRRAFDYIAEHDPAQLEEMNRGATKTAIKALGLSIEDNTK